MYTSSMNNSDKFRLVGATAKKVFMITNCQVNQEQESLRLQCQQTQKEKSLDEVSLIGSLQEFLTEKYPDFVKTITLLNKYYDNNSFKSGRDRIQS